MEVTLLLVATLFICGLLNLYFHKPSKEFFEWIRFLVSRSLPSPPSVSAPASASISESPVSGAGCELREVFGMFDKDGDGYITKEELRESLKNLRMAVTETEVEELVAKADSNGDGLIDFEEFLVLCDERKEEEGEEGELKEAFDVFDKDKDGLISVEELSSVLDCLGLKQGNRVEECREMIRKVDVDGDGMVDFHEFKMMMMPRA